MKKLSLEFNEQKFNALYLTTPKEFATAVKRLEKKQSKFYGLDLETGKKDKYIDSKEAGLSPHLSFIRLCQLYDGDETVYVFDLHDVAFPKCLRDFLEQPERKFIAHYAIFEIKHLTHNKVTPSNVHCSMLMAQFYENAMHSPYEPEDDEEEDSRRRKLSTGFGLASLIQRYFKVYIPKEAQVSDWNAKELTSHQIGYAALDAVLTYNLGKYLLPQIKKTKMFRSYSLYQKMQYVIAEMENEGMYVDVDAHDKLIHSWKQKQREAKGACTKIFGKINLRSPVQLSNWAKEHFKDRPRILKNWPTSEKTGNLTFNRLKLGGLGTLPEIEALMEYKRYATLLSTFGESLQKKINPATNRLHCSFTLGETRTGRLSSRSPNLQNMPARKGSFRHIFTASRGTRLVVADFSQIEIRVGAELSKDPVMLDRFAKGVDLHKAIVAEIEGKSIDDITKEERQLGKAINFGLMFGLSWRKLSLYALMSYGVEMDEYQARDAWELYHRRYARYSAWCNYQRKKAEKLGYTRTRLGKRRKLEEGEYYTKAVNTPVQGSAAEVMFSSLVLMQKKFVGTSARLINSVHDEVIVECEKQDTSKVQKYIGICMVKGYKNVFPKGVTNGLVECKFGKNWAEAK